VRALPDRIARFLGQSRPAVRTGLGSVVVTIAVLLATAAYGLFGQSDLHPTFEVATIKRNASAPDPMGRMALLTNPATLSRPPGPLCMYTVDPACSFIEFSKCL
jgi:hypothetical protein